MDGCTCLFYSRPFLILALHSVHALRKFALRNFARTNFYNEVHTLILARHPNANLLIRNLPNKIEHVLTKTQAVDTASLSQSVKAAEVHQSVRLTFCFGVHLEKHFAILNIYVVYTLLIMADKRH
jgi:hypothetical protein